MIGYTGAPWLAGEVRDGRAMPARSREEASKLANQLADRLQLAPSEFGRFVSLYSEHRDATLGGDIGVWSTHEPGAISREREVLATLDVGQVSRPLDSQQGFEIFERVR